MNLSFWAEHSFDDADYLPEEMKELVEEEEMPFQSYTLAHVRLV